MSDMPLARSRWLTARTVAFTIRQEGLVPESYLDTGNVWTWSGGITSASGINVGAFKDNPRPLAECLRAVVDRMQQIYLPAVLAAFGGRALAEHELAAALSFQWRNGTISHAQWVKDLAAGKPTAARADWMQWTNHGQQTARAEAERDLFFDAKWPADLRVPVYSVAKPAYHPVHPVLTDVLPILATIVGPTA